MSDSTIVSSRVRRIRDSPSSAAAAKVRELKAAGREIIDLTVGEPDFDTPRNVKDAGIAAIEAGETKYTPVNGTPSCAPRSSSAPSARPAWPTTRAGSRSAEAASRSSTWPSPRPSTTVTRS
ncbi:hypothetical protein GCM10025874_04600 [Arenivirga flava]|uniref:Aminotransferase class I/classII domain-containing protein n=1 Tax=Arenivirga flava TaxID=1930060 RepID=A0AA37UH61_9MICO|nr:hypothetical protein GCM10025874_04600 [Arenivirga flava]